MWPASHGECVVKLLLLTCAASLVSCASGGNPAPDAQEVVRLPFVAGLDLFVPIPEDNPLTAPKIALGEKLFFDPMLSRDRSVSCSSCHLPEYGFSDTTAFSRGASGRIGVRNAPALVNRAYGRAFFWDGRAASLEEQVLHPIRDSLEMDLSHAQLARRLRADISYRALFREAFRRDPDSTGVARALASYIRTLRSGESPYDLAIQGDSAAMTADARRGLALFTGKGRCTACHIPPNFTDELFHNTGVTARSAARTGTTLRDPGRGAVTGVADHTGAFKTPTLRDVARTGPYMHDGSFATMKEVVGFYSRGGEPNPHLSADIRPLHLTPDERADVVQFLESLTGRQFSRRR